MKRLLSMLLAVVMVLSLSMTAVYAEDKATDNSDALPFTDVKDSKWYADAIKYVYANGLMNGMTATTFAPEGELTRAQFAKMLWSLAGSPATEPNLKFADTKNNKWYSESLTWAVNAGIVNGYNEGGKLLFKPDNKITRDELAKMIVTFLEYMDVEITGDNVIKSFADEAKFEKWAKPYIDAVRESGLMQGKEGGNFVPKANATRAEGATILMRMYPHLNLTPTQRLEKIADSLDEYDCGIADHGHDLFFIAAGGATMTTENAASALSDYLGLADKGISISATYGAGETGRIPDSNNGCGRGQGAGGELTFTLTDDATGATYKFTKTVTFLKFYDIGKTDGTIRHFAGEPVYFLPEGCNEIINDLAYIKIAEDALKDLPTEYTVTSIDEKAIWNAIDSAINFDEKYCFETVLFEDDINNLIASAQNGVASGEIKVKLQTLAKRNDGADIGATVTINVTVKDAAVVALKEIADSLDEYDCGIADHGHDLFFIAAGGATMTTENAASALSDYLGLADKGISISATYGAGETGRIPDSNNGCGRGQGAGGELTFTLTYDETGATYKFTKTVTFLKFYDIGKTDGTIRHFAGEPVYFLPEGCNEIINDLAYIKIAEDALKDLPTEYTVTSIDEKAIWNAIDSAINFDEKYCFETVLFEDDINNLIASAQNGVASGEIKVKLQTLAKRNDGADIGATVTINVTVKDAAVVALKEIADSLDEYDCGIADHGHDLFFIAAGGATMTTENAASALSDYLGLADKGISISATYGAGETGRIPDSNNGCGRGQGAGGELTFTLTYDETGATYKFTKTVTFLKFYDIGKTDGTIRHFAGEPVYFLPEGCNEIINDLAYIKIAEDALKDLPTEYTVTSIDEKAIWNAIDSAINFDEKYCFETVLFEDDINNLIASAQNGVASGEIKVKLQTLAKRNDGADIGATVTINVTVKDAAVVALKEIADSLDEYDCGIADHGHDLFFIAAGGATMTTENAASALSDYLGLADKGISISATYGAGETGRIPDSNNGCGRGQGAGGELTFTLTDDATGATYKFTKTVTFLKFYDIGKTDGTIRHFAGEPVYFLPEGCNEIINDLAYIKIAEDALKDLPTEYTVTSIDEKAIWNAIDSAINFDEKYCFETVLFEDDINNLIASAQNGVASGEIKVKLQTLAKRNDGADIGATVTINVTVTVG